jgi:transketolase
MANLSHRVLANAIRFLSMDAVQTAQSGHPGAPMGMADIAQVLWQDFLIHNPTNPQWVNRDRFVLSNGHGAMLLYSLLHLSGYDLSIEDLKNFRQLHSKTPGHPEIHETPGVETTTGPLGQGLANGVGMALAEKILAQRFNRPGFELIDHKTYVFAGDGCLMEGISHEVCSLAGTLGLGKLVVFWDDNGISIDGAVKGWFTDNTPQRFAAYGWHVVSEVDGHNPQAIHEAILQAHQVTEQPTLICCKTTIGLGAPNLAGSEKTHGAPLGDSEIAQARQALNWPHPPFVVPEEIYASWDAKASGKQAEQNWQQKFKAYMAAYPELAQQFTRQQQAQLPENWSAHMAQLLEQVQSQAKSMATRKASQQVLSSLGPLLPELIGGSADLTGSNLTAWDGCQTITRTQAAGNYLHYGVREFGMAAIMNGLSLHGGLIPFGGTFLTFLDYARNAVRMAALMKIRSIFVFSHDSIGLGEDGPTHQPIEHITMLRATPNMRVWRPSDAVETVVAWQAAIERCNGPTSLLLSRQSVPHLTRTPAALAAIHKGGYILQEANPEQLPEIILMASGSELGLCVKAYTQLLELGIAARVVAMPCLEVFAEQSAAYQAQVLPAAVTQRLAVEAGSSMSWYRWLGSQGTMIGIDQFGASAPAPVLFDYLGFKVEHIVQRVQAMLATQ